MSLRGIFNNKKNRLKQTDSTSPKFNKKLPSIEELTTKLSSLSIDPSNLVTKVTNISNIQIENNLLTMAVQPLKREYLDMIPDFHGEAELLNRFLEISEKLFVKFYNHIDATDFQNEYLISSILSKLKGEAAVNIATSQARNWQDIKLALVNAYGDKRDCYTLNIELTELKQSMNDSPFDFYQKIIKILNLQISNLTLNFDHQRATILVDYFRKYALKILLRGLKEPLGSLMRTKNPRDLNEALGMLTNDFQNEIKPRTINQSNVKPVNNNTNNNHRFKNSLVPYKQPYKQPYNQPYNQFKLPTGYNYNPRQFLPNFNNARNVFAPNQNPNQRFPKPTPMSINSKNTLPPNQYRPTPMSIQNTSRFQPKHNTEELLNIDHEQYLDFDYQDPDDFYENHYDQNYSENQEDNTEQITEITDETTFLDVTALEPK